MSINTNIKAIKTPVRVPTDFILTWILWRDITIKPYRLEYCMVCHRRLIVQNIDARTGEQLPHDVPYVCDDCKRKQDKERRENMSEYEIFAKYVRCGK